MQEIERLIYKIPIQPLYVQFLVYIFFASSIFRLISTFDANIPDGVISAEVIFLAITSIVATSFSVRKAYGIVGRKNEPTVLKYWIEFQRYIATGKKPESPEAYNGMQPLIDLSLRQRTKLFVYAPLMSLLGIAANVVAYFLTDETYLLVFAGIFLVLGAALLYDAKAKFSRIRKLR